MGRIAKERGFDLSKRKVPYKILANELLQQLWKKADQAGRGVNPQKEPAAEPTQAQELAVAPATLGDGAAFPLLPRMNNQDSHGLSRQNCALG